MTPHGCAGIHQHIRGMYCAFVQKMEMIQSSETLVTNYLEHKIVSQPGRPPLSSSWEPQILGMCCTFMSCACARVRVSVHICNFTELTNLLHWMFNIGHHSALLSEEQISYLVTQKAELRCYMRFSVDLFVHYYFIVISMFLREQKLFVITFYCIW